MDVGTAVIGGLVGGGAMILLIYMGMAVMPSQMKMNLLLILGTMFVPVGAAAYAVGLVLHAMMSVVFGIAHGAILDAAEVGSAGEGAVAGLAIGLTHAAIVGMALGMMPLMHPRMATNTAAGPNFVTAPGFFALNYPLATVAGFFMLHAIFGIVVGAAYGA